MVMMEDKEESRVLIDNLQQVELGLSHVMINTGNMLSSYSDEDTSSAQGKKNTTEMVSYI